MAERVTFNLLNAETLRVIDEYSKTQHTSRSQVIATLLDATTPILNDINHHYQLAEKLKRRLLSEVYEDLPQSQKVVSAEKHCLEIWKNNLKSFRVLESDSGKNGTELREQKKHNRRDELIGRIESRYIKDICELALTKISEANYACFIYTKRFITDYNDSTDINASPLKVAVGHSSILLAKDVIYDEYFFDLSKAVIISVVDLIYEGVKGVPKIIKDPLIYCWIPIYFFGENVVIIPVYLVDSKNIAELKNLDPISIVYR